MSTKSKKEKIDKKLSADKHLLKMLQKQDVTLLTDEELKAKLSKVDSYISIVGMNLKRTEKMLEKELELDPKEKRLINSGMELLKIKKGGRQI